MKEFKKLLLNLEKKKLHLEHSKKRTKDIITR